MSLCGLREKMGVCFRVSPCPSIASHAVGRSQHFCAPSPADPQCLAPLRRPQRLWIFRAL